MKRKAQLVYRFMKWLWQVGNSTSVLLGLSIMSPCEAGWDQEGQSHQSDDGCLLVLSVDRLCLYWLGWSSLARLV